MATQIPVRTNPKPNTSDLTVEQFNDAMNRWFEESPAIEQAMGLLGAEVEVFAANAEAAVAELASSVWVQGTNYPAGVSKYSPTDFFSYRRKISGVSTIDPSLDAEGWALLTRTAAGGSDTTVSGVDIALAHDAGRLQVISMTAPGKEVELPAATALQEGAPVFVIKNAGSYRFAVVKKGGAFLCCIDSGQVIAFGCSDITTAAGVWAVSGSRIDNLRYDSPPEVLDNVLPLFIGVAVLSATQAVCAYQSFTTGFLWVVVVNYGSDSGDPVQVSSESVRNISIVANKNNQVTVCYQQTVNSNIRGYVIDIVGNVPVPGAVATIHTQSLGTPEGVALTVLTETKLLCTYTSGAVQVKERVLDLSGNTIDTISGEVIASTATSSYIYQLARTISATKALVAHLGTSGQVNLALQSIAASTPERTGSVLTITPPGAVVKSQFAACIMNATRAVVIKPIDRSYGGLIVYVVDISGTTPVLLTARLIQIDLPVLNTHLSAAVLDSGRIYVTWSGGYSSGMDALTLTITSDDRIILGEITERLEYNGGSVFNGALACATLDSSHIVQVYRDASLMLSAKTIEVA